MKRFLISFKLLLTGILISAQVPQGFNYQAIARDGSGNPISNTTIKIKLSILTDTTGFYLSGSGTYLWEEEQTGVKTNAFGLFTVVFGKTPALKVQGSANSFSEIDWAKGPYYLGTKIANPDNYKVMGAAQLWSVPYSMVSDSSKAILKGSKLSVTSSNDLSSDALFEVKRKDGQTVFAVYPNAVNIYVPRTTPKGVKGGFAIGGFDGSKTDPQDYLRVTPDSVRIYIDKTPNIPKGATKGGFAIGGFDQVKNTTLQDLFTVSNDSVRIYLDANPAPGKGPTKGGFAIGGFDQAKGYKIKYLNVTPDSTRILTADTVKGFGVSNLKSGNTSGYLRLTPSNYFIGHQAGNSITTGLYNSFLGYQAGYSNNTGSYNVFIGNKAGYSNNAGIMNTFIGYISGQNNTSGSSNSFFGDSTGYSNTTGYDNTFLGASAGFKNTTGVWNTYTGALAGYSNTIGGNNAAFGSFALYSNKTGGANTAIGTFALISNNTGNANVAVGNSVMTYNTTGEGNVAIGLQALYSNISGNYNVANGTLSLFSNTTGGGNVSNGVNALYSNTTGSNNVAYGSSALYSNTEGGYNVAIGRDAGYNSNGNNNVFIGERAGYDELGSHKLIVATSLSSNPLIGGSFYPTPMVGINMMPTTYTLEVGGTIWANGATITAGSNTWSDERFKTNITPIDNALNDIMSIQGVKFDWKRSDYPQLKFTEGNQIGVIAQDVEKILPQLVYTGPDGYKSVSYEKLTPVLIEAMKEQQRQIESAKQENQKLRSELEELKSIVDNLVANQAGQGNR